MSTKTESVSRCPELEDLAAFVDGGLSGEKRDAMVAHLADCEACYDVYTETLRVEDDLAEAVDVGELGPRAEALPEPANEDRPLAPVVRHPRSFGWTWGIASAIAATLIAGIGWRFLWLPEPAELPVPPVAAVIAGDRSIQVESDWYEHRWPTKRGGPVESAFELDAAKGSFRIGVHFFDLELALRLYDLETAESQIRRIESLLNERFEMSQLEVSACQELREDVDSGVPVEELLESMSELGQELTQSEYALVDSAYFLLGMWTENARMALRAGLTDYFQSRDFLKTLEVLLDQRQSERVAQHLRTIDDLQKAGNFEGMKEPLDEVIWLEGVR